MHSLPSLSKNATPFRSAALLLAVAFCIAMPLHTASAGDALTTVASALTSSSTTSSTSTSLLKSLFTKKSSSSTSSFNSTSSSSQVSRSILGLPIGILKSAYTAAAKAAGSTVSQHIKTY